MLMPEATFYHREYWSSGWHKLTAYLMDFLTLWNHFLFNLATLGIGRNQTAFSASKCTFDTTSYLSQVKRSGMKYYPATKNFSPHSVGDQKVIQLWPSSIRLLLWFFVNPRGFLRLDAISSALLQTKLGETCLLLELLSGVKSIWIW